MHGFFAPAIGLMNRLRYRGKFAVTGVLAVISISILLVSLTLHLYGAIRLVRHELAVTELMLPLQRQIQLTQQHRGLSAAYLSGGTSMRQALEAKQAQVNAIVHEVDQMEARHSTLLRSGVKWRAIRAEWERLRLGVMALRPEETLALHGQLIERLLRFQIAIADAGGLTQDSELDTYYLGEILFRSLPDMLERLGKMRAKGTTILVRKELTVADRIDFSVQSSLLKNTLESLELDLSKVGGFVPELAPRLDRFRAELAAANEQALLLLDRDIVGGKLTVAPEVFFARFTEAMDIGYRELFRTLLPTLDERLNARIAHLHNYLLLEVGLAALFLALLAYVSVGTYYATLESVRRLSVGAAAIVNGDLTTRIHLEGCDELTAVGESFNAMAGALAKELAHSRQAASELEVALVAANRADQTKDAFLANISHELRTPLNAVIGMAGLARNLSNDPRQRGYLDKIIGAGGHLNRVINDLLDLSKIRAGRMEFDHVTFSLRAVMEQVKSVLAYRAAEKGIELADQIDPLVPDVVVGDPVRVGQILLNLAGNAIKFTAKGSVVVRLGLYLRKESRVCLTIDVADTGIGIRQEDLGRLFQPFSQADATVSRNFGGTGLGLAISKYLAEVMEGDIAVSSHEGQGTTFHVRIWLDLGDAADLPPPDAEGPPQRYRDAHVLVVEDQPLNREIVEAMLEDVGIKARMARNGQEALDILAESFPDAFDVVLMDIQMPVLDGLAATRALRAQDRFAALPVIGMTAHTMEHERRISAEAGMNDHIGKPFDRGGFYRTLARWIPKNKQIAIAPPPLAASDSGAAGMPDLHTLRGVEVDAALQRFAGKEDRYRHWLADFVATAGAVPAAVGEDIAAGRPEAAAKRIHGFKGHIGMLGMRELYEAVLRLEQALRQNAATEAHLTEVAHQIAEMRNQLQPVLRGETPVAASSAKVLKRVAWDNAYSMGVAELDAQHKRLLDMINRLADCYAARPDESSAAEAFREVLSQMFEYAQVHFKAEERYMGQIGYPELAAHLDQHQAFVEKMTALNLAAADGVLDVAGMHQYLSRWLLGHILGADRDIVGLGAA